MKVPGAANFGSTHNLSVQRLDFEKDSMLNTLEKTYSPHELFLFAHGCNMNEATSIYLRAFLSIIFKVSSMSSR